MAAEYDHIGRLGQPQLLARWHIARSDSMFVLFQTSEFISAGMFRDPDNTAFHASRIAGPTRHHGSEGPILP